MASERVTPKQAYEARKAERRKMEDLDYQVRQKQEQIQTLDMFDRFVTAVERIADAMEQRGLVTGARDDGAGPQ